MKFFGLIRLLFVLSLRNAWRNPRRSFLTLAAITTGVWASVGLSALARGISNQMATDSIYKLTGHAQIHESGYVSDPVVEHNMPTPNQNLLSVLNSPAVLAWTERVRVPAVIMSERESAGLVLVGIDAAREKGLSFIGDGVVSGRMLNSTNDSGLLIGKKLAETLKTSVGKRVVIMTQDLQAKVKDQGFRVVGIFDTDLEATEKSFAFITINTAQEMLGLGKNISEISLVVENRDNIDALVQTLRQAAPQLDIKAWTELEPLVVSLLKLQNGFLSFWFAVVVVTISFGLLNTLFMAVFERTREIGLVQALGMKPWMVLCTVVLESAVLLILGTLLGDFLGLTTVRLLKDGINIAYFAEGAAMMGISSIIYPVIRVNDWFLANSLVLSLGVLFSFYPAWKAARYTPVEAIRRI